MFAAMPVARASEFAHLQGASFPVVSSVAQAFAGRDVAFAMAATLVWTCSVVAKLARTADEPNLTRTHSPFAYTSSIAQQRTAFHGASLAHVSRCTVTAPFLANTMPRAVVGTAWLVAVGASEVSVVALGAIFAAEVPGADTFPLARACAVASAVTRTGALRAVFARPPILTHTVVL